MTQLDAVVRLSPATLSLSNITKTRKSNKSFITVEPWRYLEYRYINYYRWRCVSVVKLQKSTVLLLYSWSYSPLVTGAGAGAVHPLLLLVTVLVQPLPAVVEGRLDAAHAGHRVQGSLGRAQARVVTQPGRGQGPRGGAGRAPTLPAPHADY